MPSHHSHTYNRLRYSIIHLGMPRNNIYSIFHTYARKLSEQFLHASFIVIRHNYGIYCRPWHISANPYTVIKSRYIKSESHIPAVTAHTSRNIHAFSCAGVSATPITQQEPGIVISYSGSRHIVVDSMWQTLKYRSHRLVLSKLSSHIYSPIRPVFLLEC